MYVYLLHVQPLEQHRTIHSQCVDCEEEEERGEEVSLRSAGYLWGAYDTWRWTAVLSPLPMMAARFMKSCAYGHCLLKGEQQRLFQEITARSLKYFYL